MITESKNIKDLDAAFMQGNIGIEKESLGSEWLKEQTGHETWVQCSFHTIENTHTNGKTPLRANYPGPGWHYDSTNDIFHPPRPVDDDGDSDEGDESDCDEEEEECDMASHGKRWISCNCQLI